MADERRELAEATSRLVAERARAASRRAELERAIERERVAEAIDEIDRAVAALDRVGREIAAGRVDRAELATEIVVGRDGDRGAADRRVALARAIVDSEASL